jgi:hemerythrin-like domain-containing protein
MVAVLGVLRQEHADLARLLDMVEVQLGGDGAPDFALLTGILDYFLTYPDQYHHPKEDLIYRTLCRHDARLGPVIDDLKAEHEELAIATRELSEKLERTCPNGDAPGIGVRRLARSFVETYRRHIDKEEHQFFPEALRTLTPEEWADIEAEITDPTDPLFRGKAPRRLSTLEARIRGHRGAA